MTDMIETWRGEATNWDCDELGHLNMRHYITKATQARQMFIMLLGLPQAFKANANSTIDVKNIYIRYIAEARPGQNLYIETGILELSETEMQLIHIMYHVDGRPAAALVETLTHIATANQRVFAWPKRVKEKAKSLITQRPDIAKPKGMALGLSASLPSLDTIQSRKIKSIGRGVFQTADCDKFGHVSQQAIFGRISECVGNFTQAWPEHFGPDPVKDTHGILLETQAFFHKTCTAGDPFALYSVLKDVKPSIRRLVHLIFNPITQEPIAGFIAICGIMDLNARKLFTTRELDLKALNKLTHPDLMP